MPFNYEDLETRFDCACQNAITDLSTQYQTNYQAGGPGKLGLFLELIQMQFDQVESIFVRENDLHVDAEGLRRIRAIAKNYAKKCVEEYGRISI